MKTWCLFIFSLIGGKKIVSSHEEEPHHCNGATPLISAPFKSNWALSGAVSGAEYRRAHCVPAHSRLKKLSCRTPQCKMGQERNTKNQTANYNQTFSSRHPVNMHGVSSIAAIANLQQETPQPADGVGCETEIFVMWEESTLIKSSVCPLTLLQWALPLYLSDSTFSFRFWMTPSLIGNVQSKKINPPLGAQYTYARAAKLHIGSSYMFTSIIRVTLPWR